MLPSHPPGREPGTQGITGTHTKAETKRQLAGQILATASAAGIKVSGAEMRHALDALLARDRVTDLDVLDHLMRQAPGGRRPRRPARHEWAVTARD